VVDVEEVELAEDVLDVDVVLGEEEVVLEVEEAVLVDRVLVDSELEGVV
jgi:hypothetical protein